MADETKAKTPSDETPPAETPPEAPPAPPEPPAADPPPAPAPDAPPAEALIVAFTQPEDLRAPLWQMAWECSTGHTFYTPVTTDAPQTCDRGHRAGDAQEAPDAA